MKFEDELTIVKNDIRVYLNHFCEHCGKNIIWNKWQKYRGIPNYLNGHHPKSSQFKKGHKLNCGKNHGMYGKFREECPNWKDGYGQEKSRSKQRFLGFLPINEKNEIANEMHHIDEELVIFIPSKLHQILKHSVKIGKNLETMNSLAWKWFDEEGYKFLLKGE